MKNGSALVAIPFAFHVAFLQVLQNLLLFLFSGCCFLLVAGG